MDFKEVNFNFDRPGDIYFIREKDVITGEISKYLKIGLVGDRRGSDVVEHTEDSGDAELQSERLNSLEEFEDQDELEESSANFDEYKLRASEQRLKEHQTGNPDILLFDSNDVPVVRTPAVAATERAIHARFAHKRIRGEWFMLDDSEIRTAVGLAQTLSDELESMKSVIKAAGELAGVNSVERVIAATEEITEADGERKTLELKLKIAVHRASAIENEIAKLMANCIELEGVAGWTRRRGSTRFDPYAARSAHPEFEEFCLAEQRTTTLRLSGRVKTDTKNIEKVDTVFQSSKDSLLNVAERTEFAQGLHQEYLALLSEISVLNWQWTYKRAQIRLGFGDASEIEGIGKWERFEKVSFKPSMLRPHLESIGREDIIKLHQKTTPESFSFKVLPMRPYPL